MEKKTLGSFIATLRKANGMTQKELADKLNVSDKTISRWERDEGEPDLFQIPIIADIFSVTCDELLHGEKTNTQLKAEKHNVDSLRVAFSQYTRCTYIAISISALGIIIAFISNFAFLKGVLGFFLGLIFYFLSLLLQAIFINKAFFSVDESHKEEISSFKKKVITLSEFSIGTSITFIGFTLPLLLADSYMGIQAGSLISLGSICAVINLTLYAIVLYYLNASLIKRGVFSLPDKALESYEHNHKLKRNCFILLLFLLAITFIIHQLTTSIWGPYSIMKGTTFEDYESFKEYMEQEIPSNRYHYSYSNGSNIVPAIPSESIGPEIYYDEYGNEISEEEAKTKEIIDINGNVVCKYISRNESVVSIRYVPKEGTALPITVCTDIDRMQAENTVHIRNIIFCFAYIIELIAVAFIYIKKRMK